MRIISIDPLQWEFVPQKDWATLDNIFSKLPVPDKYPDVPSKRKRPKFAERNKHGGIIIHSFADDRYYTRFDIRKSKKHPGGFTFRMGRGKFYIQETMDEEGLAAIAREISFVRHS